MQLFGYMALFLGGFMSCTKGNLTLEDKNCTNLQYDTHQIYYMFFNGGDELFQAPLYYT